MNTFQVLDRLIGRDLVLAHILRIRMAPAASFSDMSRVDRGRRVLDRLDIVNPVAADAGSNLLVAGAIEATVNAGLILRPLIDAELGVVLAHVDSIAVAFTAEESDLTGIRRGRISFLWVHRGLLFGCRAIATVTVRTG